MEDGCQLHAPAALPSGRNLGIHGMEGLLVHGAGLDVLEKRKKKLIIPGFEPRTLPTELSRLANRNVQTVNDTF